MLKKLENGDDLVYLSRIFTKYGETEKISDMQICSKKIVSSMWSVARNKWDLDMSERHKS